MEGIFTGALAPEPPFYGAGPPAVLLFDVQSSPTHEV